VAIERTRREDGAEEGGRRQRYQPVRRHCVFCADKNAKIDYKDIDVLKRFVTDRGKIRARRKTGACARHQRAIAAAVKRARHIALLPFVADPMRQS
jgi:small subunit ribosomal protein S18